MLVCVLICVGMWMRMCRYADVDGGADVDGYADGC